MVVPCLDYSKGFGGKFGVEKEKVDKAALGYDYKAETEKHQSQKGASTLAPAYSRCQCWLADLWFGFVQTILQVSGVVMGYRLTAWIR